METYIVYELIHNEATAYDYISKNLKENFLTTELLAASLAYDLAKEGKVQELVNLDKLIRALKAPKEIREAGEKLGNRLAKTLMNLNVGLESTLFQEYLEESKGNGNQVTYATVNGVVCGVLKIDKVNMLQSFIYNNTSGLITNAVKAVPLSQTAGQQIMVKLYPIFNQLINDVRNLTVDDLGLNNPGFEIRSMQHEAIYTRIYIS